jgi:hypothetical protein
MFQDAHGNGCGAIFGCIRKNNRIVSGFLLHTKPMKHATPVALLTTVASRMLGLAAALLCHAHLTAAEKPAFTSFCPGGAEVVVSHAGEDYLRFGAAVWGPNWAWAGIEGDPRGEAGVAAGTLTTKLGSATLRLGFRAARPAPNQLELQYELKAEADANLTLFVAEVTPGKTLEGRNVIVESAGGQTSAPCPLGKRPLGEQVRALRFTDAGGRQTILRFDPPCEIAADGGARLVLAKDHLRADAPRTLKVSVELPSATDWFASPADVPDEPGLASWYPWHATGQATNSVLSMADWLEQPAGKHGRITRRNEALIYNGQPIKLWGLNLCYGTCAPEKQLADKRAAFYPRYGINSVRLHKFADGAGWSGIQSKDSAAEYDPAGLDRMDYQVAKFKEAGIYVKLSAHFGTIKLGPADRRDVPFLDEFGSFGGQRHDRVSAPHSAFFYSPELQHLHIRQIVNLLQHRNAYTGLTYAEDPAICAVEIINEQSILFFTSMAPLKQSATLRRQVGERFSAWLQNKYASHDGLVKAWGAKGLDGFEQDGFPAGEHLDKHNILPLGSPWYWDPAQLSGGQAFRKQRLLDTLQFLYELQCEAYDRYVTAVRRAGYDGEILGSNWQAGRAFSHFANLHSDARVGLVDRHNYFGGGGRGKFNNASMLARAGSGSLSSGLQQVGDRPFMLSEWIHVFPNEWGVEGPAIIGAYGMGLQGWDVSYLFQNGDNATFSEQLGRQQWDVMAPQILGIFPAVSRQVLRGDVKTSEVVAVRNVHVPSLFEGRLGFEDKVVQGYDDKELDSSKVPAAALAVARCTVDFTGAWKETPVFDLKPHLQDGFVVSSTRQLRWRESPEGKMGGCFAMNTDGTKAVVGFAPGQSFQLGEVTITPESRFAAIYVTAPDKDGRVATARQWLITAMARARNTGMKFSPGGGELLERGRGPILLEPVKATFKLSRPGAARVHVLDQEGRRTEKTLPATDGAFTIDGARDRTPYYLVEF